VIARSPGTGADALRVTKCPNRQRASQLGGEGCVGGAEQRMIHSSQLRISPWIATCLLATCSFCFTRKTLMAVSGSRGRVKELTKSQK